MTYPVDDAGNPRIDFVWGHMPMQPDDQRGNYNNNPYTTDGVWAVKAPVNSATLSNGVTELEFPTGDGDNVRFQTFDWGIHDIATTGYSNYPSFLPNYGGDGDTGLEAIVPDLSNVPYLEWQGVIEAAGFVYSANSLTTLGATLANDTKLKTQTPVAGAAANVGSNVTTVRYNAPTVPNVVGLTESAANTALTDLLLVKGTVTTANNAAGATALNDGKIKTQSVAAGTKVDSGTSVDLVKYAYTVTANTNIAGFSIDSFPGHAAPAGGTVYMFLTGRTTKPSTGNTITIANSNNSSMNRNWTVDLVEDNDSYNTGGTVVTMTAQGVGGVNDPATTTGATWVVA